MRFEKMREPEMIHLDEVKSTNTWMLDALSDVDHPLAEGTVVYTMRQTAGRGQIGNTWESEPDKNISFSLLLRPVSLPVRQQFVISELCSLGILQGLDELGVKNLSVKWPNDIYVGDEKICGILIENRLMGGVLSECVLGVGINVNQTLWVGNAPNPTSLSLQGISTTPEVVMKKVMQRISALYDCLRQHPDGLQSIHSLFVQHLYRREGFYPYVDVQTGEHFMAEVYGVDSLGPLLLRTEQGQERRYWFKEVRFVLPCGIEKE